MPDLSPETAAQGKKAPSRPDELRAFLFLTVVLAPVIAVALVGGYGFVVWMSHLIFGPPGA